MLPVRILDPRPNEILIRTGEGVLQVQQSGYQARRRRWPPGLRRKERRPARFKDRPVDQFRQLDQRMLLVDQINQRLPEQIARRRLFASRTHQKPVDICKESSAYYLISGKSTPLK